MDTYSKLSLVKENDVDVNDVQAQVDVMYASILASVDMIMEKEAAAARKGAPTRGAAHHFKQRGTQAASSCASAAPPKPETRCALPATETKEPDEAAETCASQCGCSCAHECTSMGPKASSGCQHVRRHNSQLAATKCRRPHEASAEKVKIPYSTPTGRVVNAATVTRSSQHRFPPSTFGSGRKGMSEPIRKDTSPGPGSYFIADDSNNDSGDCYRGRGAEAGHSKKSHTSGPHHTGVEVVEQKAEKNELLKRQMEILCQCYWKQMPDIDAPKNPAAHASDCPCQSLRTVCTEGDNDDHTSSRSNSGSEAAQPCGSSTKKNSNKKSGATKAHDSFQKSPSVVSPRLVGRLSNRGAVFGISPRCTIFAVDTSDTNTHPKHRSSQRRRGRSEEEVRSGQRAVGDSDVHGSVPSYLKPTKRVDGASAGVSPGPGAYDVSGELGMSALSPGKTATGGVLIGRAERKLHAVNNFPGPGAYDVKEKSMTETSSKKSARTLSSSRRQLSILPTKEAVLIPGPGEYHPEAATLSDARRRSPPAFSFGRAKLLRYGRVPLTSSPPSEPANVPGPGTYDTASVPSDRCTAVSGRSAVITNVRRGGSPWSKERTSPHEVPGPGAYEPVRRESGPAYLMGRRPAERVDTTPGPGHYELPQMSTGPRWLVSESPSAPLEPHPTPGPGEYSVSTYELKHSHSSAPLFPTAPRVLHEGTKVAETLPGPGTYETERQTSPVRSAIMGTAQRVSTLGFDCCADVPGPGTYTALTTVQEPRVVSPLLNAAAPRFAESSEPGAEGAAGVVATPGPGHYDADCGDVGTRGRAAVFGSAPRELPFNEDEAAKKPGPGAYEIAMPKNSPSFSIGQKLDGPEPSVSVPGPGEYDPQDPMPNTRAVVIGEAARFQTSGGEKDRQDVPGPGAYTIERPPEYRGAAVFGTEPRLLTIDHSVGNHDGNDGIGPGSYDPQVPKGPASGAVWSAGPRFAADTLNEVPGPGAYDTRQSPTPTNVVNFGISCGKPSQRADPAEAVPGPGAYAPKDPHGRTIPGVVFGSSPQHPTSPEEREALMRPGVGPGSYEVILPVPHTFHTTFGSAADGRIQEERHGELAVGPGHYNPHDSKASCARSAIIGMAPRLQSHEDSWSIPGPGAYSLDPTTGGASPVGPVSFTTAPRFDNVAGAAAGGDNDVTPGPGYYSIEDRGTLTAAAGVPVFSRGPRVLDLKEREHALLPGPGQYHPEDLSTKVGGAAYSFGVEPRMPQDATENDGTTPGPGAYDVTIPTLTATGTRFGVEPRALGSLNHEEGPGPGTYNVGASRTTSPTAPVYRFPTATREAPSLEGSDVPGPGQYDYTGEDLSHRRAVVSAFPISPRFATERGEDEAPGPGQYMPHHPQWDSSQAYSFPMGGRNASLTLGTDGPGPGTYSPQEPSLTATAALFGIGPRQTSGGLNNLSGQNHPGPGHYNPALPTDTPSVIFGTAQRDVANTGGIEDAPGPGSYDLRVENREGIAYSIGRAAAQDRMAVDMQKAELPGPGTYSVQPAFPAVDGGSGATSFVKAARFPDGQAAQTEGPGPGAYSIQSAQRTSGPFIGRAPRVATGVGANNNDLREQPGPGHYEVSSGGLGSIVDGGVAMRFTSERFPGLSGGAVGESPGPASYSPAEARGTKDGVSFPQAPRHSPAELNDASSRPGPGDYDIPSTWNTTAGNTYSFGAEERMKAPTVDADVPGPGSYDTNRYLNAYQAGPAFTLKSKPGQNENGGDLPGPGSYDASRYIDESRAGRAFTLRGKSTFNGSSGNGDVPGPGSYDPNRYLEQCQAGPSVSLRGKAAPVGGHDADVPGPGSYDASSYLERCQMGPAFSLKGKPTCVDENSAGIPGPGSYDANRYLEQFQSGPAFTLRGKGACNGNDSEADVPGPGSYDPNRYLEQHHAGPSFTLKGKATYNGENGIDAPGPGSYDINRCMEQSQAGPSFTLRGKPSDTGQKGPDIPGPGSYDASQYLERCQAGPAFTLRGRDAFNSNSADGDVPGPGSYDVNRYLKQCQSGVSFTLKGKSAQNDNEADAPGPGSYDPNRYLEQHHAGPSFTLKGKATYNGENGIDAPGPGSYDINRYMELCQAGPAFTLKGKASQVEGSADVPGPGSYDVSRYTEQFQSGPAFTLKGKQVTSDGVDADVPGPGSYNVSSYAEQFKPGPAFTVKGKPSGAAENSDGLPGPGSYDTDRYMQQCHSGPAFTLKGKPTYGDGRQTEDVPGPGAYCPRPTETTRAVSFGPLPTVDSTAVFEVRVNATPGPAAYVIPSTLNQKAVPFGAAEREVQCRAEDVPGPGAYLTGGPVVLKPGPAFTFGRGPRSMTLESAQEDAPGPGEYHHPVDARPTVLAFTFASADRFAEFEAGNGVGPGEYYHPYPTETHGGPAFRFPKSMRAA
ncbi:hypothetical protein, conserved [Trypanosoma brucei brucei TREU927]|uniref:Sperm-tail PG-rich repeat n=1 Tax=Trypanosoma brucei brucei (strain 927/4 GUTat10.1) TaxID=185431 RepID=Q57XU0_TRYB2|nr:hypothetical protein, conserved [Trypanosoma brucei brucei TREU927]AAX69579.1 hypothetical protein, conserved [Trypanosoma brucei]AAZ12781.1 hypothetical protein, conserved [Trypanosoma brucei brucei TREU927]